jgi:uncharacterized protein YegJ (DUF2314 family)
MNRFAALFVIWAGVTLLAGLIPSLFYQRFPQPQDFLLPGVIAFATIAIRLSSKGQAQTRGIITLPEDDFLVSQTQLAARASLDRFVRSFQAQAPGEEWFVKIPIQAKDGRSEHIWVKVLEVGPDEWKGLLANDPSGLEGLKINSEVVFPETDIEDWIINQGGKLEGFYSRDLMTREGPRR